MGVYRVFSALGANLIPLVIFIIAVLAAKKSSAAAWVLFAIGAGLEFLSLIGNGTKLSRASGMVNPALLSGAKSQYALNWIFFLVFAVGAAVLIARRTKE